MSLERRQFLTAAAGAAALAATRPVLGSNVRTFELSAAPGAVRIVGDAHPATNVWCYANRVPGPELRIRHGERLRVVLHNTLAVPTTVHWHGIRLPNAMDGVPGLTQAPVAPGEQFVYEFTPPDAGTFWYHPHVRAFEQIDRGLAGALIVEERAPPPVDRDVTWLLDDWRLDRDASITDDFGAGHDLSHAGRIGNTVTINGRIRDTFSVRRGERIRLRLINAANARGFALHFEGHSPTIIAIDGQPIEPHQPPDGVVVLGAAMRADVLLDCDAEPGAPARVIDKYYPRYVYELTALHYAGTLARSRRSNDHAALGPSNPVPEPDIESAQRHEITLTGGAMGGARGAMLDGQWTDMRTLARNGLVWAMGGIARRPRDRTPPLISAARGSSHVLTIVNQSAFPHPMHLHGHHFRVLDRNGVPERFTPWRDTVLVDPRESVTVAFCADNPGAWLFHCHVLEHHAAGMSAIIEVA